MNYFVSCPQKIHTINTGSYQQGSKKTVFTQTKTGRGILLLHSRSNITVKHFRKASDEFYYLRANMQTSLFDNDSVSIKVSLTFFVKSIPQSPSLGEYIYIYIYTYIYIYILYVYIYNMYIYICIYIL